MSPRGSVLAFVPVSRSSNVTAGEAWRTRPYDTSLESSGTDSEAERDTGLRVDLVESTVEVLRQRVDHLAARSIALVESLAPSSHSLLRPFHVSVEACEDGFRVFFADAGLSGYGDTVSEAIWSLKDLILATYESLSELQAEELGPGPRRQLSVLREFIAS